MLFTVCMSFLSLFARFFCGYACFALQVESMLIYLSKNAQALSMDCTYLLEYIYFYIRASSGGQVSYSLNMFMCFRDISIFLAPISKCIGNYGRDGSVMVLCVFCNGSVHRSDFKVASWTCKQRGTRMKEPARWMGLSLPSRDLRLYFPCP
jgi:hypothetical protein